VVGGQRRVAEEEVALASEAVEAVRVEEVGTARWVSSRPDVGLGAVEGG
jgi:hypothetical protein